MGLHTELREAVDEGSRSDAIRVLAEYNTLPIEDEDVETANLLGGGGEPEFEFERQDDLGGESQTLDRQTRKLALDCLGIDSVEDCEAVQDEVKSQDAWDA